MPKLATNICFFNKKEEIYKTSKLTHKEATQKNTVDETDFEDVYINY